MHIFFSGIGGAGIGPLARLAQQAGHQVSGSDAQPNNNTETLKAAGITILEDQSTAAISQLYHHQPIDWLVYTAALSDDHPELIFAREQGIKISKRDEFLNYFLTEHKLKLIGVSGTHGKTTTTGMLVWCLTEMNIPISYAIGTNLSFAPNARYREDSEYFIYELDEYDRNMLQFQPFLTIISSIGYDHPDTYVTEQDYAKAFAKLADQSQTFICWENVANQVGITNALTFPDDTDISAIALAGEHNRRNGFLALQAIQAIQPSLEGNELLATLNHFPGTERRFEKLSDNVYTDYAHHPEEIRATLQLASELSSEVTVVYQPHQNTRQHHIKGKYGDCFALAYKVYWLPTYLTREDPALAVIEPEELIENLSNKERVEVAGLNDALLEKLHADLESGKMIVFMGAGNIDEWAREKFRR